MLSHNDLSSYYKAVMTLKWSKTDHPFNIQEIENLYPFERDIYLNYLIDYEQHKQLAMSQGQQGAMY